MIKNDNHLNKQVTAYIDKLFSGVGASQQLFDLKEELSTNIREKTADYQSRGMDEEQAFREAVITMGDLSGLVADMRLLGQNTAKQSVYSTMAARISTAGIVAGVLLVLFGMFAVGIVFFQDYSTEDATGPSIFIVAGGALTTYGLLTRETSHRYGMNKIRAALYAASIGLILIGLFVSSITFTTGETYVSIASLMPFFLAGFGLLLSLLLTGADRRK